MRHRVLRCWLRKIQPEYLTQRALPLADLGQQAHFTYHDGCPGHEYYPTLKVMEKPFSRGDPPVLYQHANRPDAKTVHEYGNGNAGDENDATLPKRSLEEVGRDEGQTGEREQIP